MLVVYDSYSGLGKKFAQALGYPTQSVEDSVKEPCILVTRNVGLGKVPDSTTQFLNQYKEFVKGVVVNGNKRYGPFYCKAGDKIQKEYGIAVIRKISGSGTDEDNRFVRNYLNALESKEA